MATTTKLRLFYEIPLASDGLNRYRRLRLELLASDDDDKLFLWNG